MISDKKLRKTKLLSVIKKRLSGLDIQSFKIVELNEGDFRLIILSDSFKNVRLLHRIELVNRMLITEQKSILDKYTIIVNPLTKDEYRSRLR